MDEMKKTGLMDGGGSEWDEKSHPRDTDGKFSKGNNATFASKDGIKEQTKRAAEKLRNSEVLMELDGSTLENNYLDKVNKVREILAETNGFVNRDGFGDIQVSTRLMDAKRYFKSNKVEQAAVLAVPAVIQNGIEIGGHEDHKLRGHPTYTFAGKITIDKKEGIMAVVIKRTTGNFYKVHRVLTPDGKPLEI